VTSLRVGDALRTLAGDAAAPPDPNSQVVRTVGPSGIYASLAAATALMGINAVVNELSGRRWPWRARAAGLAVMTFLVAGVAFGPLAASLASPGAEVPGLFGIDAGPWTPVSLALASLVFGIVGARVYGLMRSPEWWRTEADIPAERVPDEASPPS
jgi:hypothetical protein